jgi:Raf kinase inhibitor-like YbhB/YbcL family protein
MNPCFFREWGYLYKLTLSKRMKKLLTVLCFFVCLHATAQTFTLKSKDIGGQATQKEFFNGMGCTGQNISPQLSWENAPAGTESFAVTMYDKDAPTGSGFWHWVIFNLPATSRELLSGAGEESKGLAPIGSVLSRTDFGKTGYGGPCPPPGAPHEYLITVYALKSKIDLDQTAPAAMVGFYLNASSLGKASIVMYGMR